MTKLVNSKNVIYLLTGIFFISRTVLAADHDDGHQPMKKNNALSFSIMLEAALTNSPQYLEFAARDQQAHDFIDVSKSWIAGRPSLQLTYYDDRLQTKVGQKEMEYGVTLPLWRLGEKKAAQRLGNSYSAQTELWFETLTLEVAGILRANLAAIQAAEAILTFEEQALEDSRELLSITIILVDAGEVSELELMQVQSLLLGQRSNKLTAEATLVDAERDYSIFTGLDSRPGFRYTEPLSNISDINQSHPLLLFLRSGIELADANVQQSLSDAKGAPTLTLSSRRDRGLRADEYVDGLGVALSIPFGGKAIISSQTSHYRLEKVNAEVEFQNAFRALDLALHEVEHELSLIEEALLISHEKNRLEQKRWEMARVAFELGELNLTSVILALQQAHSSTKELELLQLKSLRLITEYNQIVGVLP